MTTPIPTHNTPEYSVSEIAGSIKHLVEDRFGYVRVRGEISGWKLASSGHAYFRLKDDAAVLDAVIWRGTLSKLPFKPEDGLEVVASGKLTTYPGKSSYQIVVDRLEPAGAGALMAMLEERKTRLAKEGLFDEARKKPLPFLPRTIGIITSPTGAVIRDMLHRLGERCGVHVIVWPVAVQGEGAAEQVALAIAGFNAFADHQSLTPDLLIVARGGGSVEDLWVFNEEIVVRAAANSKIPLISAVGHETDTTLIDYAADKRAPTPTAAAEMAVPVKTELMAVVGKLGVRLHEAVNRGLKQRSELLQSRARLLPKPMQMVEQRTQRLDEWAERLKAAPQLLLRRKADGLRVHSAALTPMLLRQRIEQYQKNLETAFIRLQRTPNQIIDRRMERLQATARMLEAMNVSHTLKRGFVLATNAQGVPVTSAANASGTLTLRWQDGSRKVQCLASPD